MMSRKKRTPVFREDGSGKDRLMRFNEQLKKHLSGEMMYLTEKRDEYENQILQLKIEKEQRDRTLFQHVDQKDIRKYFSPLNLSDLAEEKKDEKQKELSGQIRQIQDNMLRIDDRMDEIRQLIREMDEIVESIF
ncbi:MAG: hypothetical protein KH268_12935 [Clostridiales bacterium]|nr:hypothetical protein [Clostridiales bacterium]